MAKGKGKNAYPKLEPQKIFDLVEQVRNTIPERYRAAPKPRKSEDTRMAEASNEQEFELLAVADALSTLADELGESIRIANEKLLQDCLNIYYTTEELVQDPANAHLLPHLEEMRKAYEKSYGHPPPPRNPYAPKQDPPGPKKPW